MKKILLGVAALAMMASCSKNQVTEINPQAPGLVHLTASTTRVANQTLAGLEASAGFRVWATSGAAPFTAWYSDTTPTTVNGILHTYTSGTWNFSPEVAWPTVSEDYPMNFYAIFPDYQTAATGLTLTTQDPTATNMIVGTFVVNDAMASQIDLLGAKATANIKPANDHLNITFKHLLSKIDFTVELATTFSADVQAIAVYNVANTGVYNFAYSDDTALGWSASNTPTYTTDYIYYGTIFDPATGKTATLEYKPLVSTANPATFYADNHLMLMPQGPVSAQTWDPSLTATGDNAATTNPSNYVSTEGILTTTNTYVCMVYRMRQDGNDLVGYSDASTHPGYPGSSLAKEVQPYTGPLFVKVGYPFSLDWGMGKGYTYNIVLGEEGGLLIDQNYYDSRGNRTDLVVGDHDGDGDPETPVVPGPVIEGDTYIHLVPSITNWEEQTANDLDD